MYVIKPATIKGYWLKHASARKPLQAWLIAAKAATWKNLTETRRTYPHADEVKVASGATMTVFNIKGNAYRLIVAIHYNKGIVYIRDFMTHAEYSKDKWKDRLMATTRNRHKHHGPPADTYTGLVAAMAPRPLHDRVDYNNAVEIVGRLVGYDLNADQEDYLEAIMLFIEKYEAEHNEMQVNIRRVSGRDVLRSLVVEHNMSGADLSRLLGGSRTLGAMILRGDRNITADHARKLGKHFKLDPGVFIR
jgi:mRNA-degrading endonuclease HigB of HigAB toxin-antitoxin module/antitoxin component HigA of HigAB toxin-antitoxin module